MTSVSHRSIRQALLGRIQSGEWPLGSRIPGEMDLAAEYGCARTTVNRALQALADEGLVVRKRKGGTRICHMPVRQAKFEIPVLREQVEITGAEYSHKLLYNKIKVPPPEVRSRLHIPAGRQAAHMQTIHRADEHPFAYEERWVNTQTVPGILTAPLDGISVNEWLVKTMPFSSGDVAFSAVTADKKIAAALETKIGAAIFVVDRTTWLDDAFITTMTLYYKEGYRLHSQL